MKRVPLVTAGLATLAMAAGLYRLVAEGRLTIDLGLGRRRRDLGPLEVRVDAPPEVLFDVLAGPYLERTPRAMAEKLAVLERGEDMVLAAHFTEVGRGMRTTTVETVRFDRPHRIHFRLVRGPVPDVQETFEIDPDDGGAVLTYRGILETDLWGVGARWGALVASRWVATVDESLATAASEAERRAGHRIKAR